MAKCIIDLFVVLFIFQMGYPKNPIERLPKISFSKFGISCGHKGLTINVHFAWTKIAGVNNMLFLSPFFLLILVIGGDEINLKTLKGLFDPLSERVLQAY